MSAKLPGFIPKAPDVSYETQGGKKIILWEKVDPWILRISDSGALTVLSDRFGIQLSTLANRRLSLGMDPLPMGRPPEADLTEWEEQILLELLAGKTKADLARERGVSHQAISDSKKTIDKKFTLQARYCAMCQGAGVRPCGSDGEPVCKTAYLEPTPPHNHVCIYCGGTSSYNANPK